MIGRSCRIVSSCLSVHYQHHFNASSAHFVPVQLLQTPLKVRQNQSSFVSTTAIHGFSVPRGNPTMANDNVTRAGRLSSNDPSSFSNPDSVRTDKFHIHWELDFERKVIEGSVTHHLIRSDANAREVIFDTRDLIIKSVQLLKDKSDLSYALGDAVGSFGRPLTVQLPPDELAIVISYRTTPGCSALQWLSKDQTSAKEQPFLFSQCQAIHARSLMPCQDTPSVKAKYTAEVTAPAELTVLMSGVRTNRSESVPDLTANIAVVEAGKKRHQFSQKIPVPSYLVALVAGKLGHKQIGPRTTVWAEPAFVEAAAFDFSETEEMLQTAENLMGEYEWGIYDILVLPPSFPFGGMENPCLTFATPTLLAGDKSLANVIAHEISHSWTGNLVTNCTFEHFWLNEGFTVFAERLILGAMRGEPFRQFSAIEGWKRLKDEVKNQGPENPLTCLVHDLTGVDPDDAFSTIPYEKGFAFLYYLQEKVGGKDVFKVFFKDYIRMNRLKSIQTSDFKRIFIEYFSKDGKADLIKDVDWDTWLHAPGLPPPTLYTPKYDTCLVDASTALKNRWMEWDPSQSNPFTLKDFEAFPMKSAQIKEFLDLLMDVDAPLGLKKVQALQAVYDFNSMKNCEIRFTWLRLCIKAKWLEQVPLALQFVTEQGRMKYLRPIYRDLYAWEEVRPQAISTFQTNRPSMMYVSAHGVAKDLHLD